MIDYCYVQFVDDVIGGGGGSERIEFADCYPAEIVVSQIGAGILNVYFDYPVHLSDLSTSNLYSFYWSLISEYMPSNWQSIFPSNYILYGIGHKAKESIYGRCIYYAEKKFPLNIKRLDLFYDLKVPSLDNDIIYDPNDIFFLYDMGKALVENSLIGALLGKSIDGVNFVTILFGGAFMGYVAYVIVKWLIPI